MKSLVLHAILSDQIILHINTISQTSEGGKIQSAEYSSEHWSVTVAETKSNVRNGLEGSGQYPGLC